jgi:hypothetical protein
MNERQTAPAVERNKDPILKVLHSTIRVVPSCTTYLHACYSPMTLEAGEHV